MDEAEEKLTADGADNADKTLVCIRAHPRNPRLFISRLGWTKSVAVGSASFLERIEPKNSFRRKIQIVQTASDLWVFTGMSDFVWARKRPGKTLHRAKTNMILAASRYAPGTTSGDTGINNTMPYRNKIANTKNRPL